MLLVLAAIVARAFDQPGTDRARALTSSVLSFDQSGTDRARAFDQYGHVYERGVRELWGLAHPPTPSTTLPTNPLRRTQDEGAPRALDKRGFESFLALGVEIRRKRAELDAYLEALDPVHTGYVSLVRKTPVFEREGKRASERDSQTDRHRHTH
eukprot:2318605-Rhodomonas_salina.1